MPDFARQAAAAARTAVAERLASFEQRRILGEGSSQRGVLRDAIVERRLGTIWYVDAAGVPGMLPPEEQIPGERLAVRDHIKVVIVEGRRKGPDAVVVVSRSHPQLVQRLMEQEVPELQSGQVVIRAIARDPGRRTKVAVDAPDGDVDPQGACIGRNGVRQRAVTSELGEEQVQIVAWSADPATFVMNSLIPAVARGVELDLESRTAHISVAADQLSLAIGRGGENARLAARLTGWRIDIRGDDAQVDGPSSDGRRLSGSTPLRTCAGCRRVRPKSELIRLAVIAGSGRVTLDPVWPLSRPGRVSLPGNGYHLSAPVTAAPIPGALATGRG